MNLCSAQQPCCQFPSGTFQRFPSQGTGGYSTSTSTSLQIVKIMRKTPPKKGQQRSRGILEHGAATQMMHHEQAGCVCVQGGLCATWRWNSEQAAGALCCSSLLCEEKNTRGTQNVCRLFVRLSPPGSLHLVPCNQGCATRKGWGAANQAAAAREGEIRSRRDPTMSCSCFCYTTKL